PVDSAAVSSAILAANQAGIPVITLDRSADKGQVVSLIASDNVAGGKMAAEFILAKLGKNAKVAELEGIPGASATRERGQGFHLVADKNLNVVAKQAADFDRAKGLNVAENMLQAHSDIQAIFAQNDEMALGAVEAVKSTGRNILIVGFDGSSDGIKAVKAGQMTATVAQQPELIGKMSVQTAKQIVLKQDTASKIAVPLKLIVPAD
ncbi:MAG: substrate-binding domain-containing protein, partial [Burkholderiales bacterium]|nr:substrate-binding domain-containing protein [Burkholderiales bacterium]